MHNPEVQVCLLCTEEVNVISTSVDNVRDETVSSDDYIIMLFGLYRIPMAPSEDNSHDTTSRRAMIKDGLSRRKVKVVLTPGTSFFIGRLISLMWQE
jgi:hypothetical protein